MNARLLVLLGVCAALAAVDREPNQTLVGTADLAADTDRHDVVQRTVGLMGTEVTILVRSADTAAAAAAIEAALQEMARLEGILTDWDERSELMRLNARAAHETVTVGPELAAVLAEGLEVGRLSEGAFDITWRSAGRLWDFKADPPRLPDPDDLARLAPLIDYRQVQFDAERRTVHFAAEHIQIGFGGVAKGWIVDQAVALLKARGFKDLVVNAGGDIYASGRNTGRRLWWVAIRHPREPGQNLAVVPVANVAIVTSGDYERFIEIDGRRYCHILDPRTGWPAADCQSVTVLAASAARADALATGVFVLGPQRGMDLIERLPGVEALIVAQDGSVQVSTGLRDGPGNP